MQITSGFKSAIQRGNNRQVIFADDEDFAFFRDCLLDASRREGLAIHAYAFMTNHVHLLATPASATSAGRTLQSVGRRYVQQKIGGQVLQSNILITLPHLQTPSQFHDWGLACT